MDNTYWAGLPHKARQGLKGFGYDEDKFDCCNLHYGDYAWSDFEQYAGYEKVLKTFQMLGYDADTWAKGKGGTFDDYWWHELPWQVQDALFENLCYSEEIWNETPMLMWPWNATLPGSWNVTEYGEYVEPEYLQDDGGGGVVVVVDDDDEAFSFDDFSFDDFDYDYF